MERAQTGQQYSATERHSAVAVDIMVMGARAPVRPMQFPQEVVSGGEFCVSLHTMVSVGE